MTHQYSLLGLILMCVSCGHSSEKQPSLEQTRAAMEVRDNWKEELKPVRIVASNLSAGVSGISVKIRTDGRTGLESFSGYAGRFKPSRSSLSVDTAVTATACWPPAHSDTLALKAPFSERLLGHETSRRVGARVSLFLKFKSETALLRLCFESADRMDMLEKLILKGENMATRAKYLPYAGKWIERSGKGLPLRIATDCILNNGRSHDIYLVPCEVASDIVLTARINGREYTLKTYNHPR